MGMLLLIKISLIINNPPSWCNFHFCLPEWHDKLLFFSPKMGQENPLLLTTNSLFHTFVGLPIAQWSHINAPQPGHKLHSSALVFHAISLTLTPCLPKATWHMNTLIILFPFSFTITFSMTSDVWTKQKLYMLCSTYHLSNISPNRPFVSLYTRENHGFDYLKFLTQTMETV